MLIDRGLDHSQPQDNLPDPAVMWAQGYRFLSRYLCSGDLPKRITAAELATLRAHGFEVALNWEQWGDWEHDYSLGAGKGTKHATEAVIQARALGYPAGSTIYHSIDFDATLEQLATGVTDYSAAYRDVMHTARYRAGAYGSRRTLAYLFDHGLIDDGWQTYAWSSVNGVVQWEPRAAMRQVHNGIYVDGKECDLDERHGVTYLMGAKPRQENDMSMWTDTGPSGTIYLFPGALQDGRPVAIPQSNYPRVKAWWACGVPDRGRSTVEPAAPDFFVTAVDFPWPPAEPPVHVELTDEQLAELAAAVQAGQRTDEEFVKLVEQGANLAEDA